MSGVTEPMSATATRREPILICYEDSPDAVRAIEAAAALLGAAPRRRRRRPALDDAGREHGRDLVGRAGQRFRGAQRRRGAADRRPRRRDRALGRLRGRAARRAREPTWEGIVGVADELDAAVIVIGSRGLTGMKKIFDASIS
jgi:nucleotide-binding universal stress UspA family protein